MNTQDPYLSLIQSDMANDKDTQKTNPYLSLVQADVQQQTQQTQLSMSSVADIDPDADAKLQKLAQKYNLPIDAVRLNSGDVERRAKIDSVDYAQLSKDSPTTAGFLADPAKAAIAHDDVDNLSAAELTLRKLGMADQSFKTLQGPEAGLWSITKGVGTSLLTGSKEVYGGAQKLIADLLGDEYGSKEASRDVARAQFNQELADPEFESKTAGFFYNGAKSTVQNLPSLALGTAIGGPAGIAAGLGLTKMQTQLPAYTKYRDRGASIGTAYLASEAESIVEIGTEMAPMGVVVNSLGKLGAKKFIAKFIGHELAGEEVATFAQDAIDTAIANPDKTWGEYWKERPEAAYQTAIGTLVGSGALGAVSHGAYTLSGQSAVDKANHRAAKLAEQATQGQNGLNTLQQINTLAADSKLRQRDPESFKQFVEKATEDGPVQDVYLDVNTFKQSGVDLSLLAQASPSIAAQLETALQTGGDIKIPISEFATNLAGNEYSQSLIDHIRTDPNGMTGLESKTFMQDQGAFFQAEVEKLSKEKELDDTFKTSQNVVRNTLLDQLQKTDRFKEDINLPLATMVSNFYAVTAAKLGVTPEEFFTQNPLTIQAAGLSIGEDSASNQIGGAEPKPVKLNNLMVVQTAGQNYTQEQQTTLLEQAKNQGHDGVILRNTATENGKTEEVTLPVQKPEKARSGENYNQGARGAYSPSDQTITIFKEADLSTFLHESGHFFLDMTQKIAAKGNVPEVIKQDMAGLTKWFASSNMNDAMSTLLRNATEMEKLAKRNPDFQPVFENMRDAYEYATNHGGPEFFKNVAENFFAPSETIPDRFMMHFQRYFHEQFARGFENYLFEGKAPSLELQPIFQRFRAWILSVYRTLKYLSGSTVFDVQLSDEARGVFDRMLATSEQIQEAQAIQNYGTFFKNAQDAGMTAEQWTVYANGDDAATQEAISYLESKSLKDLQWYSNAKSKELKRLQKENEAKRIAVKKEVTEQVMSEPVNQARTFLKKGIDPVTGEKIEGSHKLNIDVLRETYGDGQDALWRRLDSKFGKYGILSNEGAHPDMVADMFGFSSGDELVRSLISAENPTEKISALTDLQMLERFGDITNEKELERTADQAIHNELRTRNIVTQHNALQKALGGRKISGEAAKQFAEITIARAKIRDLTPSRYSRAEARAAKASQEAFVKGNIEEAAVQKRNQLIQNNLTKSTYKAQEEVEKSLKYLKKFDKKTVQKNLRGTGLEQILNILERFDLRSSISLKELDKQDIVPLGKFIENQSEKLSAAVPELPEFILNDGYRVNYKNMAVEEMRGVVDSVKQLEKLARRENEQYLTIRQMSFDEEKSGVLAAIRAAHPKAFNDITGEPNEQVVNLVPKILDRITNIQESLDEELSSPEVVASRLEGGGYGAVHESLFSRMSNGSDYKGNKLSEIYIKHMKPLYDKYSVLEKIDFSRKDIGGDIGIPITREKAVGVALLNGNKEGRARLANYGWAPAQIQSIVDLLEEKDVKLIEGMWGVYDDNLWPELKALNERTRGIAPPKVESAPFMTRFGEVKGGYHRLKYDANLDEKVKRIDEGAAVKELLGNTLGMSAKTKQGTSTERLENVALRPRLDLGVFAEAVNETVHDLAFREAVGDTMRMLNDKQIQRAIKESLGKGAYNALLFHVRNVASPPRNPSGFIEKTLSIARKNTVINLMSGVRTALQNFTGILPAFTEVGAGNLIGSIFRFYSPKMLAVHEFAVTNSAFMRNRLDSFDRDLQNVTKKFTINGQIMPDTGAYLKLMGWIDKGVAIPVWTAAYSDGMKKFSNDKKQAIEYADHKVRVTQGSGRDVDLAQISASNNQLKKAVTMFYSYFNSQLNLLIKAGAIAKQDVRTKGAPVAVANFTARFMFIVVIPSILTTDFFSGGGDDERPWYTRWLESVLSYGAGMLPIVRDLFPVALSLVDPNVKNYGYKLSPIESAVAGISKGAVAFKHIFEGEGDKRDTKNAIMGVGFAVGLPGKLVSDTVMGTDAFLSGEADPTAVLFGPPKK